MDEATSSTRARVGVVCAVVLGLLAWFRLPPTEAPAATLFAVAIALWVSEAIPPPATAMLVVGLAPVLGACSVKEAFAALGNPILFLFVGGFMIAEAMRIHGLGDRVAQAVASRARGVLSSMVLTSLAAFLLSMWISNAASTAIVLPVALSLATTMSMTKAERAALVLSIAWGASMGGLCTPVGTPPNLIGMRALAEAGTPVHFLAWMLRMTPIAAGLFVLMWLVLWLSMGLRPRPNTDIKQSEAVRARVWSRGEVAAAAAFTVACVGWFVPGVLEAMSHPFAPVLRAHLSEEVVAMLAASLLFFWPIGHGQRALTWAQATRIEWGTAMLFGGGILLGEVAHRSGLVNHMGLSITHTLGVSSGVAVLCLVTAVSLLLSELASNTAAATLMIPLAMGLAHATNTNTTLAVMGATVGASFGFAMPISTAPNAMAYATGEVSWLQMVRAGLLFDVVGLVVVVVALWWLW
jgi:solute carrier family 13 (sodium-dependent dicarboxylate transporter), member 2/3/5